MSARRWALYQKARRSIHHLLLVCSSHRDEPRGESEACVAIERAERRGNPPFWLSNIPLAVVRTPPQWGCSLGVEFVHDVAHRVQIRKTVFLIRLQMAALAPFVPGVDKNILQVFWQMRAGMLRHGAQGSGEYIH